MRRGDLPTFEARDRRVWRAWLKKNHLKSKGVSLVYYKKGSGRPSISYNDAVEEALCFGWIDSRVNRLDERRYMQMFTPRKARSGWSPLNKQRVERLIDSGLMTDAGMEKIREAKRDGSWKTYDGVEKLAMPRDLAGALRQRHGARRGFDKLSPSVRKYLLWWLASAKRPETRMRRIEKLAQVAAKGQIKRLGGGKQ